MFSPFDVDSPFAQQPNTTTTHDPQAFTMVDPMNEAPSDPPPMPTVHSPVDTAATLPGVTYTEPVMQAPPMVKAAPVALEKAPEPVRAPMPGIQNLTFFAKKKGGTVKNWKSRFWLFEPTGGLLSYFGDKDRKVKKGHVDLSLCTAIGPVRHDRVPHTLGLRTKDRLWVLAFDSADEMGRVQTALGSVVQGFLEVQDVPVSAIGKIKRGFSSKKTPKSSSGTSPGTDKSNAHSTSPDYSSSSSSSTSSSGSSSSFISNAGSSSRSPPMSGAIIHHMDERASSSTNASSSSSYTAAGANEKAALLKLNHNLSKIREYTGKEFTLECDMSIVRARLESDHPDRKDHPGDVIYDGFMTALAQKLLEICESPLYRDVINHKCSGRIAIRISDNDEDKAYKCPYMKLEQGTLAIICHRSLLTASLVDLGEDLLDVLSVDEPLHICAIKDIEDHKQGIKSCLIKIQSNLGVTCQFECDYTEGFKILATINPVVAQICRKSWGEVIYKILDAATAYILRIAADPTAQANFVASIPNKAIRITIIPHDELSRTLWYSTDSGSFDVLVNAALFSPDRPISF